MINVSKSYAIDPIKIFMMNNVHIEKEVEKSSFQRDSMKRLGRWFIVILQRDLLSNGCFQKFISINVEAFNQSELFAIEKSMERLDKQTTDVFLKSINRS